MVLLLATDIAAVDHHEGTITLIANAVNWNGTDERVDWAYDDAVARLDVMTAALAEPLKSTVATFGRPAPAHRAQRTVEEYTAIVDKLVGDIEAGEELCHDYAMARVEPYRLDCLCGTDVCRGVVTETDWQRADVQARYAGYVMPHVQARIDAG